jgi:hypothetical protein
LVRGKEPVSEYSDSMRNMAVGGFISAGIEVGQWRRVLEVVKQQ